MANDSLHNAKRNKDDEFYTQLSDIENELNHYKEHFNGKTVFCNCDDPKESNFWQYFSLNFEELHLKRLLATHYNRGIDTNVKNSYMIEMFYDNDKIRTNVIDLVGDGDFRSNECIELLKQSDIVVTNPPFSLFREYIALLIKYKRKFIILGNQNAIKYKEVFPLIKENKVWLGYKNGDMAFKVPQDSPPRVTRFWIDETGQKWRSLGNICWFTNLDIAKRHEELVLYKTYNTDEYQRYDDYDAINIDKTKDIPYDYDGVMGVPITFIDKHCPTQFEIVGELNHGCDNKYDFAKPKINGVEKYPRILIQKINIKDKA